MISNHYIPEHPSFKSVIHSIWQLDTIPKFQKEHIIPKGIVEVIFNFSDSAILAELGTKQYHLPNCFINGFNTSPIQVRLPEHQVYFGVLFQPLAIKNLFRTPASEFSDITVDLTLLDPKLSSLWHQLADQNDFNTRVSIFLGWLQKKFIEWLPQEQFMNSFLYSTNQHHLTVAELANTLCYSPRHLSRKLCSVTGMNTEEFLLYKKYLHAVDLIHDTELSLTEIASQSHFSDQSHFIKTFKSFAELTPGTYKHSVGKVKGHIYEDVR